ncbi:MAG: HlyD family type I secretion periplasmic adaptor subunit [Pseudomonadota bacterium]
MSVDPQMRSAVAARWSAGRHVWLGLVTLVVLVFGFGAWSAFANISGAVVAQGKLKVESERQVVQHPEGGVVKEILVKEGDTVSAGDVLIRLDDKLLAAELAIAEGQLYEIMSRSGRLEAERDQLPAPVFVDELLEIAERRPQVASLIEGQRRLFFARRTTVEKETGQLRERQTQIREEIIGAEAQQEALSRQLEFVDRELTDLKELQKKGLAQASRVLALERENARLLGQRGELIATIAGLKGQISEIEIQLLGLESSRREEAISQLRELEYREYELREQRNTLIERIQRLEIIAPRTGRVIGMTVFTIRSVVQSAEPLLYVVPTDVDLIIEAQIDTINVDQVFPGQEARLRFSAFSARTTPEVFGQVLRISPDAFTDDATGRSYYMAQLEMNESEYDKLNGLELVAGMPVETYIQTGSRTPINYFTKPLTDYFNKALRED